MMDCPDYIKWSSEGVIYGNKRIVKSCARQNLTPISSPVRIQTETNSPGCVELFVYTPPKYHAITASPTNRHPPKLLSPQSKQLHRSHSKACKES